MTCRQTSLWPATPPASCATSDSRLIELVRDKARSLPRRLEWVPNGRSYGSHPPRSIIPSTGVRTATLRGAGTDDDRTRDANRRAGRCRQAAHARPPHLSLIHISEPTRLGMISYAVFCLKKKKKNTNK